MMRQCEVHMTFTNEVDVETACILKTLFISFISKEEGGYTEANSLYVNTSNNASNVIFVSLVFMKLLHVFFHYFIVATEDFIYWALATCLKSEKKAISHT